MVIWERSKTNVISAKVCQEGTTNKMKLHVSSRSPWDQGEAVNAQPKLPSWEGHTWEHLRVNISNEMKLTVSSHSPQDRGEAVNTQPWLPKQEVQWSNRDMHRQDACQTGVRCHSPHRKWGARTLTCVNILYVIQIMWQNNRVNNRVNRKHVTQLTHQKCLNADLEFHVPHQYDASLAGPSGADNWVPRALLSSCFIILPCAHKVFFLFVSFTLEWS